MKYILLFLILSIPFESFSQIILEGEIREKSELRNGYKNSQTVEGSYPEFLTTQRTVLGVQLKKDGVTGKISFQDIRTWGDTPGQKDIAGAMIKEGWLEFKLFDSLKLKAGRQILIYDDERLLASANWNDVGMQHDMFLFKFKYNKLTTHVGLAYNNEKSSADFEAFYNVSSYKTLSFIWAEYKFNEKLRTTFLGIIDNNVKEDTRYSFYRRNTYGANFYIKPANRFLITTSLFRQDGYSPDGKKIDAWLLTSNFKYLVNDNYYAIGNDYYTGSDPSKTDTSETKVFNKLYGTSHKFLGYMDYFPGNNYGIHDVYLTSMSKISKKSKIECNLHNFFIPHNYTVVTTNEKLDSYLGTELDVVLHYSINKDLKIMLMQAFFKGTKSMDEVKGGTHKNLSTFSFLMLTWKPKFEIN